MTPITGVAWGYVVVVLDLRFGGADFVPDLLGWLLALWGLSSLTGHSRWFSVAGGAGVAGLLVAIPVLGSEPGPALATLEAVWETAFVFGVCSGIRAVVAQDALRRTADGIRWLDLGLTTCLVVMAISVGFRPVESIWAIPLGIGTLVVSLWFLVFVFGLKDHESLRETAVGAVRRTN